MPLIRGLCHVQRTSHSSLGVTTSRYCVLIIGSDYLYDHAPRRRTLPRTTDFDPLGPCPSSENFVMYNGLRPSGPTPLFGGLCHVQQNLTLWANAPHQITLSHTTDFDPLGQHPSSEDFVFVTYNRLRPSGSQ
jgi:hypothetical protein